MPHFLHLLLTLTLCLLSHSDHLDISILLSVIYILIITYGLDKYNIKRGCVVIANPQKEDGHVDIANEIVEALAKIHLSSYESQVLWAIFRKTYGWHKKEDWISNTQIAGMTGIAETHVSRTIKILIQKNLIIKSGKKLSFQKDYDRWKKLPKGVTSHHKEKLPKGVIELPKGVIKVTKGGKRKLPKGVDTKETITKETITKENIQKTLSKASFDKEAVVYQLVIYFEGKIRENNEAVRKREEPQIQSWCQDMDYLIRIDKAKPNEIKKIIDWVVEDKFWAKNILCPASLQKHYPRFYKEVIDRGKSLEERIKTDHRLDDID